MKINKYPSEFKLISKLLATQLLIFFSVVVSHAQSDNYWSWNFNTPSTLLAGAVVGGSAGPSAAFYNPALIDHENVPTLSLSASLVSLQFYKVENIAGEGIDASKFLFRIQPRFISFFLQNANDRLGLEVAVLTPVAEEIQYTIQHTDTLDLVARTEGPELYSGYLKYRRKYQDTFVGFGASYQVLPNLYIGGSSFISIKILDYDFRRSAQAFQVQDSVIVNGSTEPVYIAQNNFSEQFQYVHLSLVFKLGLQYKALNERIGVGLNLTFPNLRVYGDGKVRKAFDRSNVFDDDEDNFTRNYAFVQLEKNLKTTVKSPFSIALGFHYFTKKRKNGMFLTAEYFDEIDPYAIVNPTTNTDQVPEDFEGLIASEDFMSYYARAKAVTNAALGFKQYISKSLMFFGGFRTDFTAGVDDNFRFLGDKFKINQIHVDKYHLTLGPVLTLGKFDIITGLKYTRGRNRDKPQIINYADPVEYDPITMQSLEGPRSNSANVKLDEIALFFGLTVDLDRKSKTGEKEN